MGVGTRFKQTYASVQVLPFARDLNFAKSIIIYMLFRAALTELLFFMVKLAFVFDSLWRFFPCSEHKKDDSGTISQEKVHLD